MGKNKFKRSLTKNKKSNDYKEDGTTTEEFKNILSNADQNVHPASIGNKMQQAFGVNPSMTHNMNDQMMSESMMHSGMMSQNMMHPGMDSQNMMQPGMMQPSMMQPGMMQPNMMQPGMMQPGMMQSYGQNMDQQQDDLFMANSLGSANQMQPMNNNLLSSQDMFKNLSKLSNQSNMENNNFNELVGGSSKNKSKHSNIRNLVKLCKY